MGESNVRQWESGSNIDNRALARLLEAGADIGYILTGRPTSRAASAPDGQGTSAPCTHGKLCERLPKLLGLLAGYLQDAVDASPEEQERQAAQLRSVLDFLEAREARQKVGS